MSKHKRRRERRERYYRMLDGALASDGPAERRFVGRVHGTLNREGLDIAHDGRPIKADLRRYVRSRRRSDVHAADACERLMERAVDEIHPRRP